MHQLMGSALVQKMACYLLCTKPLSNLNQCWVIFNWTFRNKFQCNFNQNIKLFIHENVSENIACETGPFCPGGDELTHCGLVQHRPLIGLRNGIHEQMITYYQSNTKLYMQEQFCALNWKRKHNLNNCFLKQQTFAVSHNRLRMTKLAFKEIILCENRAIVTTTIRPF